MNLIKKLYLEVSPFFALYIAKGSFRPKKRFAAGPVQVPSIPKIQRLIEAAWSNGFDRPGCEQLNGKLANTKKWIGATEASVLLMSFKLRFEKFFGKLKLFKG